MSLVDRSSKLKKRKINDDRSSQPSESESEVHDPPKPTNDDEITEIGEEEESSAQVADDSCAAEADDSEKTEEKSVPAEDTCTAVQINSAQGNDDPSGFRCVDVNLLASFVSRFPCPSCKEPCFGYSDPVLVVVEEKKTGLASVLQFICGSCGERQSLSTSAKAGPSYEINSRFNAAMFLTGNDSNKAKRFCSNMKMPDPLPYRPWMNKNV